MLLTFLAIVAGTLLYLSLAERTFQSEAKIFIRPGRESVTVDPIVTGGQVVTMTDARESEVNAISDMLGSRVLLERVVDRLTPETILEKQPEKKSLGEYFAPLDTVNLNPFHVYSLRDKAIKRLSTNLTVLSARKTSIVSLDYEASDPVLAKSVLDELITIAQDEHVRVHRTKGSQPFFEGQKGKLKENVTQLEEQLRQLKDESGLASFEKQRELHLVHIATLEGELAKAQYSLRAAEDEARHRREMLAKIHPLVETSNVTDQPNDPKSDMRKKLYELQLKEADLSSKLVDTSPLLIQVRGQVAAAQKVLDEEEQKTQKTLATNKAFETMEVALHDREALAVSLQGTVSDLTAKIAGGKARLETLNQKEVELARLQRELDLATSNYKKYSDNLELARINDEVEAAKISSINVLQPPSISQTPVSPDLKLGIPLGVLVGAFSAIGVALLAERRRKRTPLPVAANGDDSQELPPLPRTRRAEALPTQPR